MFQEYYGFGASDKSRCDGRQAAGGWRVTVQCIALANRTPAIAAGFLFA